MQHTPGTQFHRSTLWRRKRSKVVTPDKKQGGGRRRRSDEELQQMIYFAGGIIDRLRKNGSVSVWEFTTYISNREFAKTYRVPPGQLLAGKKTTVSALQNIDAPPQLILWAVGSIACGLGGALLMDGRGLQRHRQPFDDSLGDAWTRKQESFKRDSGSATGLRVSPETEDLDDEDSETVADSDALNVIAPLKVPVTPVHRVREFSAFGLNRRMCSVWKGHKKARQVVAAVAALVGPIDAPLRPSSALWRR